jgi:4-hydroxy-4-methyl-2-oxoglutarate aldolase
MMSEEERARGWTDRLATLYTPVLADVLDRLGYREQAMRADIRPLFPVARAAGVARTVRTIPAPEIVPTEPYRLEMAAVDDLKPGDVMVVSECNASFWGELLSTAARYRGCRGVVIDGYTRDTRAIVALEFPVFCRGVHPADSLGRIDVVERDVPIRCGDVLVHPGDLILADEDGIVTIPRLIAEQAITRAEEKVRGENLVRHALSEGMSVTEAFRKYGIL